MWQNLRFCQHVSLTSSNTRRKHEREKGQDMRAHNTYDGIIKFNPQIDISLGLACIDLIPMGYVQVGAGAYLSVCLWNGEKIVHKYYGTHHTFPSFLLYVYYMVGWLVGLVSINQSIQCTPQICALLWWTQARARRAVIKSSAIFIVLWWKIWPKIELEDCQSVLIEQVCARFVYNVCLWAYCSLLEREMKRCVQ